MIDILKLLNIQKFSQLHWLNWIRINSRNKYRIKNCIIDMIFKKRSRFVMQRDSSGVHCDSFPHCGGRRCVVLQKNCFNGIKLLHGRLTFILAAVLTIPLFLNADVYGELRAYENRQRIRWPLLKGRTYQKMLTTSEDSLIFLIKSTCSGDVNISSQQLSLKNTIFTKHICFRVLMCPERQNTATHYEAHSSIK